jgi:hypothetical protein
VYRAAPRAAAIALLLALTACGGSDDDRAADAVAKSLMEESGETFEVTQEQADCVGDGFVERIGVDQLQEYGVITDDLEASDSVNVKMSQEDAEAAAAVLVECTDASQLFRDAVFSGEEVPEEAQACLDDALTDDLIEAFFAATFTQDQAAATEAMAPLQECMTG